MFSKLYSPVSFTKETWRLCPLGAIRLPPSSLSNVHPHVSQAQLLAGEEPDSSTSVLCALFIRAADTSSIALQDLSKQMAGVHSPKAVLCNSTRSQGENARPSPVLFLSDCADLDFYSFLLGMKQSRCRGELPSVCSADVHIRNIRCRKSLYTSLALSPLPKERVHDVCPT